MSIYVGKNSIARNIKGVYVGKNSKARKIKAIYIGINNKAQLIWKALVEHITKIKSYQTLNEYKLMTDMNNYSVDLYWGIRRDKYTYYLCFSKYYSSYTYFIYKITINNKGQITNATEMSGMLFQGVELDENYYLYPRSLGNQALLYISNLNDLSINSTFTRKSSYTDGQVAFEHLTLTDNNVILARVNDYKYIVTGSSDTNQILSLQYNTSTKTMTLLSTLYVNSTSSSDHLSCDYATNGNTGILISSAQNSSLNNIFINTFTISSDGILSEVMQNRKDITSHFSLSTNGAYRQFNIYHIKDDNYLVMLNTSTQYEYLIVKVNNNGFEYSDTLVIDSKIQTRIGESNTFLCTLTDSKITLLDCNINTNTLTYNELDITNNTYPSLSRNWIDGNYTETDILQFVSYKKNNYNDLYIETKSFDFN